MNDLRKAAEMALKQLQRDDWYLGHRSKTRADAITALQQALDDEPPVKSYCGGKPNYCTPEETPDVDAENMTQDCVDETAKGEHKVCYEIPDWKPGIVFPAPKREWVGLTDEDLVDCESEEDVQFVKRIEAKLKEKNA